MIKIVLDLEFTRVEDPSIRETCKEEIIQIGAVKLDNDNNLIDRFDSYVKPRYSSISHEVSELTSITDAKVADADDFVEAMGHFLDWAGDEDYRIYSWSDCDLVVMNGQIALTEMKDKRLALMRNRWIDAQAEIGRLIGIEQSLSLKNALSAINIDFEGQAHSALVDAENTSKIVALMDDEAKLREAMAPIIDLFAPTEELTTSLASMFAGIKL